MPGRMPVLDPDQPPVAVLWAVGLLALVFLGGGIFLFLQLGITGVTARGPEPIPDVRAVLTEYRGPIWGVETAREALRREAARRGLNCGEAVTVFPESPARLRLLSVACWIGYLLPGRALSSWPGAEVVVLSPGVRYRLTVRGNGNQTGPRAFRLAARNLAAQGLRPGDGERYEVAVASRGFGAVEHWLTVVRAESQTR